MRKGWTLGSVYSQMSEHKLAIDCFKRALVFADKEAKREIRIDIALEFENMGAWQEAIRNLHEALEEDALNETAVYELAFATSEPDNSSRQLRSTSNSSKSSRTRLPLGTAWAMRSSNVGATPKPSMRTILPLPLKAHLALAYHQKAEALVAMERYQDALHTYEETLTFEDPSPSTRCYMGECLERIGDLERAETYYRDRPAGPAVRRCVCRTGRARGHARSTW